MRRDAGEPVFGISETVKHNKAAKEENFRYKFKRKCTICLTKIKALSSWSVILFSKLNFRFSHNGVLRVS